MSKVKLLKKNKANKKKVTKPKKEISNIATTNQDHIKMIKTIELANILGYEGDYASHKFYIDMCKLGILIPLTKGYTVAGNIFIDNKIIEEKWSNYGIYQLWNYEKFSKLGVVENEGIFIPAEILEGEQIEENERGEIKGGFYNIISYLKEKNKQIGE
jgi:hypothetical protein